MVKKSTTTKPKTATKKTTSSKADAIAKKFGNKVGFNSYKSQTILDVIPTGSLTLDMALGVGGIPRGRITEISGLESTGKSTLTMNIVANAQKLGYQCTLIDAEFAFDPEWATKIGVDPDKLHVFTPDTLEAASQLCLELLREDITNVIIFDSVAALDVEAALEGEMGDSFMGKKPLLLSAWMRQLASVVYNKGAWVVLINQLRMKMNASKYEDPYITPGGMAIPFFSSVRIRLFASKVKGADDEIVGAKVTPRVQKNKVAPPHRKGEYIISFENGQIDQFAEVAGILAAKADDFNIQKAGSWYTLPGALIGQEEPARVQGANGILAFFEDPVVYHTIVDNIRKRYIKHEDAGSRTHTGAVGDEDTFSEDDDDNDYGDAFE